jgi:hypothetical protein
MKLANRALIMTLLMLTLVFTATAQNLRSARDPRNTAPTVGGGGATGGPTGLFTVYDGETLRKGEYTLSFAISNFDRDPGNVDFTTVPLSFQIGLTDHIELFFGTEAYRGVKVNSPRNLSGFYLPNSQFVGAGGGLQQPPAIVLAPRGPGASLFPNRAVYRPPGAPFLVFPFVGGTTGNYGLAFSGPSFGFPAGTNATIGAAASGGAADLFPGLGSVYGGILPGVVLQTACANGTLACPAAATVPTSFTLAPSYNADAPFINRTWGTSSFNHLDFGAKVALNSLDSPVRYGFTVNYRWYLDKADDRAGFNMMQRGAGPGANWGDLGVGAFASARLAKWANLSGNIEYVWTSAVKGDFPGGEFTLLDRGDELRSAIGMDFPVNRYFQPIIEVRSQHFIGGRTPNAFENDPIDVLAGARIFPTRWMGFGLAYRYHTNQQDSSSFDDTSRTSTVTTFSPTGAPLTLTTTTTGRPAGFLPSNDPHGYIAQFFIGRRDKRQDAIPNVPADVTNVTLSDTTVTLPCPPNTRSREGACNDSSTVRVSTTATDKENDPLTYTYTVTGGRITGSGANVDWDLTGVRPGTYSITTAVNDGCGICGKTDTRTITVEECRDCVPVVTCDCATLTVSGPTDIVSPGSPITFTANYPRSGVTYNWSVSNGTIESGQGTPTITVSTTGLSSTNVTATATISGITDDPSCNCDTEESATAQVGGVATANLIDELGPASNDDVKQRVDNLFIALGNDPTARGLIQIYGTQAQIRARRAQIMRAINRPGSGHDAGRIDFEEQVTSGPVNTKFWVVPAGAARPGL